MSMVDDYRIFTVAKTLAPPLGEIFDFRVPPAAREGEVIQVAVGIRNLGDQSGAFWAKIVDLDTGATVGTGSVSIAGGSTDWIYPTTFLMPARNLRLRANVGHDTAVDSYVDKTVPLMAAKGEIVSYNAPSEAKPGVTVTVTTTAKNVGTGSGSFQLRLRDRDTNTDLDSTGWFTLAAAASALKTLEAGAMPDRNWNLTLLLERTLPTGQIVVDDSKAFITGLPILPEWLPWWLIAAAGGGLAVIATVGVVAYQEAEKQKMIELMR